MADQNPVVVEEGGVQCVKISNDDGVTAVIELILVSDPPCSREGGNRPKQWFNFRVQGINTAAKFLLKNAGDCDCGPFSFQNYEAFVLAYDDEGAIDDSKWRRAKGTSFKDQMLEIVYENDSLCPNVWVAYFPPYSLARHSSLLEVAKQSNLCSVRSLGLSVLGNHVDCIHIHHRHDASAANSKLQIWMICRQHPSETQGEWWCEGLVKRLLRDSAATADLLSTCDLHLVPCANPDGALYLQLTRTNAAGRNLNREWKEPSPDAPEVQHILDAMCASGVDLFVDVHADEGLESGAISCCTPAWTPRLMALQKLFITTYQRVAGSNLFSEEASLPFLLPTLRSAECSLGRMDGSDGGRMDQMQDTGVDLSLASTQVGHRFDCLALTLEQPFKGCTRGWEDQCGALQLGSATVDVLIEVAPWLRSAGEVELASLRSSSCSSKDT